MGIEFRLLGRLEVLRDGEPVDLGSQRQRALLALLLVHAASVLSTDRILDELWGDSGTSDKHNSLWVYVSGLRGALGARPRQAVGGHGVAHAEPWLRLVGRPLGHRRPEVRTERRRSEKRR